MLLIPQYLPTVVVRKKRGFAGTKTCSDDHVHEEETREEFISIASLLWNHFLVQFTVHECSTKPCQTVLSHVTQQPICVHMDSGSLPCLSFPAATSAGFQYSPKVHHYANIEISVFTYIVALQTFPGKEH